jgi:hypothetical protein
MQSITLASGKSLERAPTAASKPNATYAPRNEHYYTRHWGINE